MQALVLYPCRMSKVARYVLLAAVFAICCLAQSERGTIAGTVTDQSGAVVPGVNITVTENTTGVVEKSVSNDSGFFEVPNLPVGTYAVTAEKTGFSTSGVENLVVDAGSRIRADLQLQVGNSSSKIEVVASAAQLQTDDARTAVTVENQLVRDLPLVVSGTVRTPFDLATLTPEAKRTGDADFGFALGGGQAASYGTSLDGVSTNTSRANDMLWIATNSPSVEAIDQFVAETNGFKAEYGHAGGGQLEFASKSGGNQYHGAGYEFLRNQDMDANYFFNNVNGVPRAILKQNDFGATIGGPIWIPKIYNGHDKTFFFFSYEGFRNRAGVVSTPTTIPTPEMYTGDFSNWVNQYNQQIPIYDPTTQVVNGGTVTRQQFSTNGKLNVIPVSKFDPQSIAALKAFQNASGVLKPNLPGTPGTYAYSNNNYLIENGSFVNPTDKYSVKVDHVLTSKDRISFYYGYNSSSTTPGPDGPPTLPGDYQNSNNYQFSQTSSVYRFGYDRTFSSTMFNHFYAGGNNWVQVHNPLQELQGNWKSKFCLGNVPDCNQNLVQLTFNDGYAQWGAPANNGSEDPVYAFNDDFSFIKGDHTFKLGGMFQETNYNGFGRQCVSGCATFSNAETGPGNTTSNSYGNPFASFLIGWADSGQIDTVRYIGQQFPYYAAYFQDDWRVNRKLVLNLGLRWETTLPPREEKDRYSDFSPITPNPGAGNLPGALVFAGFGPGRQNTRTLATPYFGAVGPHVGIAYSWTDKTVIRTSFARSFAPIQSVSGSTHQRGFTQTYGVSNSTQGNLPTFTMSGGFPPYQVPPFISPSFINGGDIPWWQNQEATRPPENDVWNFSIQHQLPHNTLVEASYNGVIGTHLQSNELNYNQVPYSDWLKYGSLLTANINSPQAIAAGFTQPFPGFSSLFGGGATVAQALRPFPQYHLINTTEGGGDHSGHSSYHAGIARIQRRFSNGFSMEASYVFSKLLTDSDTYWTFCCGSADQYNRRLDKSIGAFDITHSFKLFGTYELPFGKNKPFLQHGVAGAVLGGWRVAGIGQYQTGLPIGIGTSESLPIFNGRTPAYITSYDGWYIKNPGHFDATDNNQLLVPWCSSATVTCNGPFPYQGVSGSQYYGLGNATRYNPKARQPGYVNENVSLARTFNVFERLHLEVRGEAFNVLNRHIFQITDTTLQDTNFGRITGNGNLADTPRQMQLAARIEF